MQDPPTADRLLLPAKAGAILGVTAKTVRLWNLAGLIGAQLTPRGQRRYRESEVLALAARGEISKEANP
jgi:DNA-binding transcriptional MerR regulator